MPNWWVQVPIPQMYTLLGAPEKARFNKYSRVAQSLAGAPGRRVALAACTVLTIGMLHPSMEYVGFQEGRA